MATAEPLDAAAKAKGVVRFQRTTERGWPIVLVTANVESVFGYPADYFLSRAISYQSLIHPDDRDGVVAAVEVILSSGTEASYLPDYRFRMPDGSFREVRELLVVVREPMKRTSRLYGYVTDITEQNRAYRTLQEAERRYRDFTEVASDWLWETGPDMRFTFFREQRRVARMGDPPAVLGKRPWELDDPDMDSEAWHLHRETLKEHRPFRHFQHHVKVPSGKRVLVSSSGTPRFDEAGCFAGYRGITVNLSAEEAAVKSLAASQERFRNLAEGSIQGIVVHRKGPPLFANQSFAEMFGYEAPEQILVVPSILTLAVPADRARLRRYRDDRLSGKMAPETYEYRGLCLDGSIIWVENRVTVIEWEKAPAILTAAIDVTERKHTEEKLKAAKVAAENATAVQSRFLAAASHELRQPVQALNMFVDALARRIKQPVLYDLVQKIDQTAGDLGRVLNTLLDVTRLEAGVVVPTFENVKAFDLFVRLFEAFEPEASQRGLRLRVVPPRLTLRTDPVLLERILSNLLGNAIHYTTSGSVLFGCRRCSRTTVIQVWDTGMGMTEDEVANIFREFYRGKNAHNSPYSGLGLGLTIVEHMCGLLGLRTEVESSPGHGTVFSVEVPLASRHRSRRSRHKGEAGKKGARKWTVVLAESDPLIREATTAALTQRGCSVIAGGAFDELMCVVTAKVTSRAPDMIIADIWLTNGQTGADLVKSLRDRFEREVPAILMSATAAPAGVTRMKENRVRFVRKPIPASTLFELMNEMLEETR